jgi:hypothetical protein
MFVAMKLSFFLRRACTRVWRARTLPLLKKKKYGARALTKAMFIVHLEVLPSSAGLERFTMFLLACQLSC